MIETHRYFQRHPEEAEPPEFVASKVASAHESLAIVLQKRGRTAEAEQELVAAANTNPASAPLLTEVGAFYEKRRELAAAAEWYARAALVQDRDPGDARRAYRRRMARSTFTTRW